MNYNDEFDEFEERQSIELRATKSEKCMAVLFVCASCVLSVLLLTAFFQWLFNKLA